MIRRLLTRLAARWLDLHPRQPPHPLACLDAMPMSSRWVIGRYENGEWWISHFPERPEK